MRLLEPFTLGSLKLPNRVLMAPLTRRRAGAGKIPTDLMARYYAQRASAGLIISESTEVDPRSGLDAPTRPGLFTDAQAMGWRQVVDAVHDAGGRIFVQLSHLGRAAHPLLLANGAEPIGPSAIAANGNVFTPEGPMPFSTPREIDILEIPGLVAQFAQAAQLALDSGFDGVEVHGANGYLIDQFLRSGSNRRIDAYGGSIGNRVRFLAEVTEAIVGIWGAERVGVRLSPWSDFNGMSDADPRATFAHAAEVLDQLGIAYLHFIEEPTVHDPLTADIRGRFGGALIVAGGYQRENAGAKLADGTVDLVAFGQAFIANPDLPERFACNAALNPADRTTFYAGGAHGYVDYSTLAHSVAAL
ncbi:MAG: NADH:flavin oxidoreductase [Sphingomonadales bacterium]|nr:NADH:flavin oxidoreductase [Sphingomonadales bacterium]